MTKIVMTVDDGNDVGIQVDERKKHFGEDPEAYEIMQFLVGEHKPVIEWYEEGILVLVEQYNPETEEWEVSYECE